MRNEIEVLRSSQTPHWPRRVCIRRLKARRIIGAAVARSAEHGHSWTQGQRDATRGLLLSTASITGIQGAAGTAKTTTVLSTYADAARARGLEVRAHAPTATAAKVLGDAIRAEPMTIAKMPATDAGPCEGDRKPETWIVDEASMMGARDAEALVAQAQAEGARLVLVGDVAQLGSVEAGRSFGHLQNHGMATFKLEGIVRQSNAHTREAVEAILARDFARLSREERARTLVLDPARQGRQELTNAIRAALVIDGTLGQDAMVATVLDSRDLTRPQARLATS